MFNFNNMEEFGLLGPQVYVEQPWFKDVKLSKANHSTHWANTWPIIIGEGWPQWRMRSTTS